MSKIKLLLISTFFIIGNVSAFTIEKNDDAVEGRFVVSPARIDYNLAAGDSINIEMVVVNRLGERKDFFVKAGALGEGEEDPGNEKSKDWFSFEKDEFTLDQGERAKFDVSINIPENTKSSGYYNSILVGTKGENAKSKDQIMIVSQIGVPVLLTVGGENIQKKAGISKFMADHLFYRNGPVGLVSSIENQGNVHLQVSGEISIYNLTGAKIGQVPLKEWVLLPGAKDEKVVMWTKRWLLGKYKADARFFYDNGKVLGASYDFYAFPWHVSLAIILVLIALHFLIRYLHSRYEVRLHLKKDGTNIKESETNNDESETSGNNLKDPK